MIRVVLKVRDKNKVEELKKYGPIVYCSPYLNIVSLDIEEKNFHNLKKDENVINCEIESEGKLMPV